VMTDVRVRRAVGAMLNRDALIAVGTANGVGGVRDDAQLLAPSEPGYRPTAPSGAPLHPDPNLVNQLLTSAGYTRNAQGRWTLLGGPLHVTVGAPTDRPRFQAIAQEVTKQLDAAGVDAVLVTVPGTALFTDPTVVPTPPTPSATASPTASPSPSALADLPPSGSAATGRLNHGAHGGPGHAAAQVPVPAQPPAQPLPRAGRPAGTPTPVPGAPGAPGRAAPGQPAPGQPAPGQPAPGQPAPGQPAPGQPAATLTDPSGAATATSSPPPAAPAVPVGVVVDLSVMPRAVGADLASTAASNYGCPPGMAGVGQPARNSTGFCFAALQPLLDATLGGALAVDQASVTIESDLWQQLPAIPLFQVVTTLASTPKGDQVTGNIGPGALTVGPFATAPSWQPLSQ